MEGYGNIPAEAETQTVAMELLPEEAPPAQESLSSTSKKGEKGRKRKGDTIEGGGSFKEQPYTFLAPEDPILMNCR